MTQPKRTIKAMKKPYMGVNMPKQLLIPRDWLRGVFLRGGLGAFLSRGGLLFRGLLRLLGLRRGAGREQAEAGGEQEAGPGHAESVVQQHGHRCRA